MERKKYILAILLFLSHSFTNATSYKSDVYKAYIGNNMDLWKKVIDHMEQQKIKTNEFRIELLNYQYGYIAWCIGNKKNELAEHYIKLGENNIKVLENAEYRLSCVNAYKSAFYGYKIGLSLSMAPFLGTKSIGSAQMAIKQDPTNANGFIQHANAYFYMPAIFGGSKQLALLDYKKAESLMENHKQQTRENWNYLSLLTMIAKTYTALNDHKNATYYYEKILNIEPNFLWVKNELYPELLKKTK